MMRNVKKGATLLEVVIALAIIAIMIMPLMSSLLTSVSANKKGEEVQDAKLMSQQVVESLRLQDQVEPGVISVGDMDLSLGSKVNSGGKGYFPVSSTESDGFSIEGKIIEEKVSLVNDNTGTKEYKDKKLGALLVVDSDKVYYSNNNYKDKSIEEMISKEKGLTGTSNFSELPKTAANEVNVKFTDAAISSKGNNFNISINESIKVNDTEFGIGIYVIGKNKFKFNFENQSNKTQNIYVFRESYLSKDDGILKDQIHESGLFNKYTNIIFDSTSKNNGLYTAELNVKRKGKVLETTQAQFYLKE